MTHRELIQYFASRAQISQKEAKEYLDTLFGMSGNPGVIPATLLSGDKLLFPGFGTLLVETVPGKIYWNTHLQEKRISSARAQVKFKTAKGFHAALNPDP